MDERPDAYSDAYDTRVGRVKPVMNGRSIALPPIAPIVGALGLLLGLVAGLGLAQNAVPAPTAGPTEIAVASPTFSAAPSVVPDDVNPVADATFELPPADGLSLAKALETLSSVSIAPSASEAVSARVARWSEIWPSPAAPKDVWVRAITMRSASPFWCTDDMASASASPPTWRLPVLCSGPTTEMFVLDYRTGDFLEAMSPARP